MLGATILHKLHQISSQQDPDTQQALLREVGAGIQWDDKAKRGPFTLQHLDDACTAT